MSHLSPDDFVEAATRAADVAKQVLRRQIDFEAREKMVDFLSGIMNDFRKWLVIIDFRFVISQPFNLPLRCLCSIIKLKPHICTYQDEEKLRKLLLKGLKCDKQWQTAYQVWDSWSHVALAPWISKMRLWPGVLHSPEGLSRIGPQCWQGPGWAEEMAGGKGLSLSHVHGPRPRGRNLWPPLLSKICRTPSTQCLGTKLIGKISEARRDRLEKPIVFFTLYTHIYYI